MGSYGRNFEFRVVPEVENRLARYATPATGTWVIGAPVESDGSAGFDGLDRQVIKAATTATAPQKGKSGILVYEYGDGSTFAGDDPYLTTYSDKSTAPVSRSVQLVSGPNVKVVLRNTAAQTFLQTRSYAARTMVAGLGTATPTIAVGDLLEPATTPSDTNGYWQETATAANAWLKVVHVDNDRAEAEAIVLF